MDKYRLQDIKRLRGFLDELKPGKSANKLVNTTKLTNLLNKIGFVGPLPQAGSKLPFYHELLKDHPRYVQGRILVSEAHGKKNAQHYDNFKKYCSEAIEYVLNKIEEKSLIITEEEENNVQT